MINTSTQYTRQQQRNQRQQTFDERMRIEVRGLADDAAKCFFILDGPAKGLSISDFLWGYWAFAVSCNEDFENFRELFFSRAQRAMHGIEAEGGAH